MYTNNLYFKVIYKIYRKKILVLFSVTLLWKFNSVIPLKNLKTAQICSYIYIK